MSYGSTAVGGFIRRTSTSEVRAIAAAPCGLQGGQGYRQGIHDAAAPAIHPLAAEHIEHALRGLLRCAALCLVHNRRHFQSGVAQDDAHRLGERVHQRFDPDLLVRAELHRLEGTSAAQQRCPATRDDASLECRAS